MRIVFFTRLFYPHIGGVEKHVYEIGKRLIDKGHNIVVVTEAVSQEKTRLNSFDLKGFEIHRIPVKKDSFTKKFKIWKWLWLHRELFRNADIIHVHDVFFWYLPFRFLYPTKKVYTTFHGYETVYPPRKKAIIVRKLSEVLSHGNICIGDYIKKWYGTKPNIVTYGGVYNKRTERSSLISKKKLKILYIGRLEEDTGGYIYNEVLQLLQDSNVSFSFTALGDGSLRRLFERWGEVKGFIKDIEPLLQRADVVFASSYLSILQSLALKKPVFAIYDNPLKRDYLTMAPFSQWITIKQDPVQLTHALMKYRENSNKFQDNITKASLWSQEQTWEKVTNQYLTLWEKSES